MKGMVSPTEELWVVVDRNGNRCLWTLALSEAIAISKFIVTRTSTKEWDTWVLNSGYRCVKCEITIKEAT